jgi:hypothetical protein
VHVGCIQSDGAVNWRFIDVTSGGDGRCEKRRFNNDTLTLDLATLFVGAGGPNHDLRVTGTSATEDVPYGVVIKGYLDLHALDPTALAIAMEQLFGMPGDSTAITQGPRMFMSTQATDGYTFELRPRSSNLTMTITAWARDSALASIAINAANCQANTYRAGIWGFRF